MELLNKVIVITGATSGIGHATALLLASKGAKLGLLDIVSPKGVEEEIAAAGGQATAYQCDVRLSEQVERAANMAGVIGSGKKVERSITSLTETSDEEWNRIIDINVGGTKNCLRAELRHMSSGGSLVNASSVSALIGSPWNVAYSTSKAAIIGLTKSLAQETWASSSSTTLD
ncbi:hypothetical protein LTS15_008355 [Exophiala xenobiotica]|nr:hypothetical protein LTS15_008355 [Exophiala xenobiotica]